MQRTMYADPRGIFLHDLVLESCRRFPRKTAIVDTSCSRQLTYGEYGDIVEKLARGLSSAGIRPGDVVAIYLPNCWEFAALYHAATLAGAIPTLINPSYREREVRYQLEDSGAAVLISDAPLIAGMNLAGLPSLRRVYTTRTESPGAEPLSRVLEGGSMSASGPDDSPDRCVAALPYSSGTTGLPKGVMLSHYNLVANVYQLLVDIKDPTFTSEEVILGVLPMYHIYGLNVVLNPVLTTGATLVLLPRFDLEQVARAVLTNRVTMTPVVPPMLNAFCIAAERGLFPREHTVRWAKSGAAPLASELAQRFTKLTGIPIVQGYGMTEASPVTHMGSKKPEFYRPESIGWEVAQTECRIVDEHDNDVAENEPGELVMRGPQFMLGYWKSPDTTAAVLRDGWYWSGDVVRRDANGFYYILDRRKEMIKYKGFAVAPAEIESVLMEHASVRDCGVVARPDPAAGEVPCAFVVLREGYVQSEAMKSELAGYVADRLAHHKQPREIIFVDSIPHTPSGKILRRELRRAFAAESKA
ncbi:MAG TPA: AMP-binding protein [Terriglobales bacterium]|nr:AMP-binding protein [Terriglobales bacterium]